MPPLYVPKQEQAEYPSVLRSKNKKKRLRRQQLLDEWNGRCAYCPTVLTVDTMTLDHLIPKSRGGTKTNNLVPACGRCNLLRANFMSVAEFNETVKQVRKIVRKVEKIMSGDIKPYGLVEKKKKAE